MFTTNKSLCLNYIASILVDIIRSGQEKKKRSLAKWGPNSAVPKTREVLGHHVRAVIENSSSRMNVY